MIRLVRITGFLLIAAGTIVVLTWFIEPLRQIWPWLLELPLPIRIGVVMAAFGILLLVGSLLWERWEDRENDRSLLKDE
jgi:drug/metabolite transporter superfamily protein YnfA